MKKIKASDKHRNDSKTFEKKLDATGHLMSSKANEIALTKSIKQIEEGNAVKIALEDLWK
jgi:hypothetical protein